MCPWSQELPQQGTAGGPWVSDHVLQDRTQPGVHPEENTSSLITIKPPPHPSCPHKFYDSFVIDGNENNLGLELGDPDVRGKGVYT